MTTPIQNGLRPGIMDRGQDPIEPKQDPPLLCCSPCEKLIERICEIWGKMEHSSFSRPGAWY